MRTEERLEIARAKENLWRRYQEPGKDEMEKEEEEAWQKVLRSILELEEEEGVWKKPKEMHGMMRIVSGISAERLGLKRPDDEVRDEWEPGVGSEMQGKLMRVCMIGMRLV